MRSFKKQVKLTGLKVFLEFNWGLKWYFSVRSPKFGETLIDQPGLNERTGFGKGPISATGNTAPVSSYTKPFETYCK